MTDYFALLNLPRQPWLEPDDVKARFLELSAAAHPDRVHNSDTSTAANDNFAQLNKAATVLREPKDRLHHLLELETNVPRAATANLPNEIIPWFAKVAGLLRETDAFLGERGRATSPVLQAQLFASGLDLTERLESLQREVGQLRERADAELRQVAWPADKPLARLGELAHIYATVHRWQAQLQERFASLAGG